MLNRILIGIGIITIADILIKVLVLYYIAPKLGEKLVKVLITFINFSHILSGMYSQTKEEASE